MASAACCGTVITCRRSFGIPLLFVPPLRETTAASWSDVSPLLSLTMIDTAPGGAAEAAIGNRSEHAAARISNPCHGPRRGPALLARPFAKEAERMKSSALAKNIGISLAKRARPQGEPCRHAPAR